MKHTILPLLLAAACSNVTNDNDQTLGEDATAGPSTSSSGATGSQGPSSESLDAGVPANELDDGSNGGSGGAAGSGPASGGAGGAPGAAAGSGGTFMDVPSGGSGPLAAGGADAGVVDMGPDPMSPEPTVPGDHLFFDGFEGRDAFAPTWESQGGAWGFCTDEPSCDSGSNCVGICGDVSNPRGTSGTLISKPFLVPRVDDFDRVVLRLRLRYALSTYTPRSIVGTIGATQRDELVVKVRSYDRGVPSAWNEPSTRSGADGGAPVAVPIDEFRLTGATNSGGAFVSSSLDLTALALTGESVIQIGIYAASRSASASYLVDDVGVYLE